MFVLVGPDLDIISVFKWESLGPFQHRCAHKYDMFVHHDSCKSHAWIRIYQPINKFFFMLLDKARNFSLHQPIYHNLCSCAIFFPLLCLCLRQHPSSQLSTMACGLTMLVNIYCFFCMIDMESLVSLLLQRMVWKLPEDGGRRKDHLRAAEMLFNKDLRASHWTSTISSANYSGNKQKRL